MNFNKNTVKAYMRKVRANHIDHQTDEVNATSLAEDAAGHFNQNGLNGPLDDETHWIWDAAVEVAG